jgi:hypothetical protein
MHHPWAFLPSSMPLKWKLIQPFRQTLLKGRNEKGFTQKKMTTKLAMNKMEQAAEN